MKWKLTALILALVLAAGVLAGCSGGGGQKSGGKAGIKIILVLEDETEATYDINVTAGATLREALFEAELISEETNYAMFVDNIDGHVADAMNDGVTWMPYDADGNQITGTFDDITVEDGQTIKLVYSVVPNFDD